MPTCTLCDDCGWVCEVHPDRPWEGPRLRLRRRRRTLPGCNSGDGISPPRLPQGFKTDAED
jgi:hypothetical protein